MVFARTSSGKMIPLAASTMTEVQRAPGELLVVNTKTGYHLATVVHRAKSHFADCPKAGQFRNTDKRKD